MNKETLRVIVLLTIVFISITTSIGSIIGIILLITYAISPKKLSRIINKLADSIYNLIRG